MNLKNSNKELSQYASQVLNMNAKSNPKTKNIIVINNTTDTNIKTNDIGDNMIKENNPPNTLPKNTSVESEAQFKLPPGLSSSLYPQFNSSVNYYHEFWRMYLQNEVLISQMKEYVVQTKEIQAKINNLEEFCHELELNRLNSEKKDVKKKNRRTASEIEKNHMCPYEGCNKLYGSDVSLNLHIKLKHNGGNKTEREKLARSIFLAKINGEKVPDIGLNLPPGFLQNINPNKLLKDKESEKLGIIKDKDSMTKSISSSLSITNKIDMDSSISQISEKDIKFNEDNLKCELENYDNQNNSNHNIMMGLIDQKNHKMKLDSKLPRDDNSNADNNDRGMHNNHALLAKIEKDDESISR